MRPAAGGRRVLGALPLALATGGCVYLNGVYNAERAWATAEEARLAGRDSAAEAGYEAAAAKAARSYARDPGGAWADDALYLEGRALLRNGRWVGARSALERARAVTDDATLRLGATLYLGALAVVARDEIRGLALLNEALAGLERGQLRAEGHLWRARLHLARGLVDQGWWDLLRAGEEDPRFRTPAALEQLTWGVVHGDLARAREGARALLLDPAGGGRADTVATLVAVEERLRGPASAAHLLEGADGAAWAAGERDRMVLLRAALHVRAGDLATGVADAIGVAVGAGEGAIAARLFLARLALERVERVEELDDVRPELLPVSGHAEVARLLEGMRRVALLAERGRRAEPVALFAAAELARDGLDAPALACALFLEYAEGGEGARWRGKALLAAAAIAPDPGRREALRARAASLSDDPYVAVARGLPVAAGAYEALERGLRDAVAPLLAEVVARGVRSDSLGGGSR